MRNISFSKTTEQVRNRTKTVTRRFGWWFLKPGDRLWAIEKGQGLKKGEKVKRICQIEVVSTKFEMVRDLLTYNIQKELSKEGFPDIQYESFFQILLGRKNYWLADLEKIVNRIEFKYI